MNPSITEHEVSPEIQNLIHRCAASAARVLEVDTDRASEEEVVGAIDECVHQLQKGAGPKLAEDEQPNYLLGSLWGEQLVRKLGWQWAEVIFRDYDDAKVIGVASPDRSLAIYPFHFIEDCLEGETSVTILLAFNMLIDGRHLPTLPAYGYENVMDHVHHIVPRE